jgi:signal transduction histidine kinase
VKHFATRLWPRSLAGRLVLLLVAALAAAQFALVFILRSQQDNIVEEMAHGQALSQTVTLARLLTTYPPDAGEALATAFGSRESCARVSAGAPADRSMTAAEHHLAGLLGIMLHGVNAGAPQVAIEPIGRHEHPCGDSERFHRAGHGDGAGKRAGKPFLVDRSRMIAVAMTVPLPGQRWLTVRTTVGAPGGWSRATLLSFLLSSLAVAVVAIISVHTQTRSLRALADASDRLGRGETVAALRIAGPSEVAAATRAFNTMQERLNLFMRDRLKLLAGISHDLRTPLTTLRLKAEFIDDEAVRQGIVATIDELIVISEATLAFTRAEATTEATEAVDLHSQVAAVAEAFRLTDADVVVAPFQPLIYACRPVALKRAFRNLIENAVRYGGNARISAVTDQGTVTIAVEDDGPGLPPDQIEDAFQPFVRLEPSRSTETGGIGLGLAIARSVVKAHGGTVTLINRPEGGLRAEIRLPPPQQR